MRHLPLPSLARILPVSWHFTLERASQYFCLECSNMGVNLLLGVHRACGARVTPLCDLTCYRPEAPQRPRQPRGPGGQRAPEGHQVRGERATRGWQHQQVAARAGQGHLKLERSRGCGGPSTASPSEVLSRIHPETAQIVGSSAGETKIEAGEDTVRISSLPTQIYPKSWFRNLRDFGSVRESTSPSPDSSPLPQE